DGVEQRLLRDQLAGVLGQMHEDGEGLRPERHQGTRAPQLPGAEVEVERGEQDVLRGCGWRSWHADPARGRYTSAHWPPGPPRSFRWQWPTRRFLPGDELVGSASIDRTLGSNRGSVPIRGFRELYGFLTDSGRAAGYTSAIDSRRSARRRANRSLETPAAPMAETR